MAGDLLEKYGWNDAGECLTIADKNEVWHFEVLGPGKGKTGAVWAAQRVPDDHISVNANASRIRRIDLNDKDFFMASKNVYSLAEENGWWDKSQGEFEFAYAYAPSSRTSIACSRREWRVFNLLAPSLKLDPNAENFPFSVKPDTLVSVADLVRVFKDYYEGTEFDMTRNWKLARPAGRDHEADTVVSPLANPWLTTTMRNTLNTIAPGTIDFKRTVAVAWCAYSHVTQLRSWLPDAIGGICWLSVDNPAQSPRIPVFCGTTVLPEGFWTCGQNSYSENSALWSFRRANKLATLSWQTTKEGFNKEVMRLEDLAFEGLPSSEASPSMLNSYTAFIYNEAVRSWKAMEEKYWMQFGMGF